MSSAIGGFFSGGGKGITWPDQPPKTVTGVIRAIHPPEAVKDPKTGQPTDREQVRIEIETDERDPEIQYDDGVRTLYVKSYMRGAIGDALRQAGEREPKPGGRLTVHFTHTEPPERPGLSASKHFQVQYQPPAATGNFFGGDAAQQAPQQGYQQPVQQPVPQPQYQQPVPQPQYQQQPVPAGVPQQAPQQVPVPSMTPGGGYVQPPQPEPQRPASIAEAAWAAMDLATKVAVSNTIATMGQPGQPGQPPF